MKKFISLEEAIEILNSITENLGNETIDLVDAVGRVIFEDVTSEINNPPFNKSTMDGYAILSEDTDSASEERSITLRIIDEVFAGNVCKRPVNRGQVVKIMTGAPIPKGANAVIKQEDVVITDGFIEIDKVISENTNISFEGEDIKKGQVLVKRRKKLNYADIGIIASAGINKVKVYKKPKIALISTGDEVLDINESLKAGKIYNSNKYSLMARIQELGYEITLMDHVGDSPENISEKIKSISREMDLIITTGGVSVGEKDFLINSIDLLKGEKLFWKIKIKPGSAILCSKVDNSIAISLSGNPTAALTTFELLVRPVLDKLSGKDALNIKREKAILKESLTKKSPQRRFVRGYVYANEKGQYVSITQVKSGNGILSSTLNSNCLIEIDAGNEGIIEGEVVTIIKL